MQRRVCSFKVRHRSFDIAGMFKKSSGESFLVNCESHRETLFERDLCSTVTTFSLFDTSEPSLTIGFANLLSLVEFGSRSLYLKSSAISYSTFPLLTSVQI